MTTAVQKAPRLAPDDAVEFAAELYDLRVTASTLPERTRPELFAAHLLR